MNIAAAIVDLLMLWGMVGALAATVFLIIGIDRIDEDANGSYLFRLLLAPGVILLWPLVLWRWWILETGRDRWALRHAPPRRPHAPVWLLMAALIPAILMAALVLRQTWPAHIAPELISAPKSQKQ